MPISATKIAGAGSSTAVTTATFPAQAAGTWLVLQVSSDDYRLTTGTNRPESSGWTNRTAGQDELGSYTWTKLATGAEASVNYAIGSAVSSAWEIIAVTGATDTLDNTPAATHTHGGSTTASGAVTPSAGNRYVLALCGAYHSTTNMSSANWSNSYTAVGFQAGPSAGSRENVAAAGLATSSGVSTSSTATWVGASQLCSYGTAIVFREAASGGGSYTGTLAASSPRATSSIAGTVTAPMTSGTLASPVPRTAASLSGTATAPTYTGAVTASVPSVTGSLGGSVTTPSASGTVAASTPVTTSTIAGAVTPPTYSGTMSTSLPRATGSMSGTATPPTYSGTLTVALPPTRSTITGTATNPAGSATLSGTVPRVIGSLSGAVIPPTWTGTLGGQLAPIAGTMAGTITGPAFLGTIDATLPKVSGILSGTAAGPTGSGALVAVLPRLSASLVGVVEFDPGAVVDVDVISVETRWRTVTVVGRNRSFAVDERPNPDSPTHRYRRVVFEERP